VFRGKADVRSFCLDQGIETSDFESDLIVFASEYVKRQVDPRLIKSNNYIVARRTIDISNLDLLQNLPKTRAIMVDYHRNLSEEAISLLYGLGFNHLELIPYYPGVKKHPKVGVAITPGEPQIVPSCVNNVIDIGCKIIDVTTLTEILIQLDLLDDKVHLQSALMSRLIESIGKNRKLSQLFTTTLNNVHDCLIATDADGSTTVFNKASEKFFGISAQKVIGYQLHEALPQLASVVSAETKQLEEKIYSNLNGHKVMVNRSVLRDEHNQHQGLLLNFISPDKLKAVQNPVKVDRLATNHVAKHAFSDIIGSSPVLLSCLNKAKQIGQTDLAVLITGETGTGKELLAQSIHNASPRCLKPFVAVNCAAIPSELLESEFFGYEEGAFTGARRSGKLGLFELASGGTVFLDEIGCLSIVLQAKLLRVLEQNEIMRIGSENLTHIDIRVVAATNLDLKEALKKGQFRHDLYYRLNGAILHLPPLSKRQEDIYSLTEHFLKKWGRKLNGFFNDEAWDQFLRYPWPGNIRELRNKIDYLAATCQGKRIDIYDLPPDMQQEGLQQKATEYNSYTWLRLLGELSGINNLEGGLAILQVLNAPDVTGAPKSMGRQRISKLLAQQDKGLSESTIKTWLKILVQKGLVESRVGRQGTRITSKGQEVLAKLKMSVM
jgi:PAS domain S-box-containing protein